MPVLPHDPVGGRVDDNDPVVVVVIDQHVTVRQGKGQGRVVEPAEPPEQVPARTELSAASRLLLAQPPPRTSKSYDAGHQ